jgi:hypothetical protein
MIFRDASVIKELARVFEEDWAAWERAESADVRKIASLPSEKPPRKWPTMVSKNLPVGPVVKEVAKNTYMRGSSRKSGILYFILGNSAKLMTHDFRSK